MQIPNSDKPDMDPSAIDNKRFRIQKVENPEEIKKLIFCPHHIFSKSKIKFLG